jgi:hypothetical protein
MKRLVVAATLVGAAGPAGAAVALPPFTTGAKSTPDSVAQRELAAFRTATQPEFDRMVFQFRGGTPGFRVRYVARIIQDGSGATVPLLGSRFLAIRFAAARAHPLSGASSNVPRVRTPLFPSIRQVKLAGDFEGVVSYGVGIAGRKAFRVFRLTGPPRIVVDVRH